MPRRPSTSSTATRVPSELTRGPWDPGSQHAGPPAALLGRAIERLPARASRCGSAAITFEILRPVPIAPLRVEARIVRPGRRVEMVAASLGDGEGEVMRARGWRLRDGAGRAARRACSPGTAAARAGRRRARRVLPHRLRGRLPHRDGVPVHRRRVPRAGPGDGLDADAPSRSSRARSPRRSSGCSSPPTRATASRRRSTGGATSSSTSISPSTSTACRRASGSASMRSRSPSPTASGSPTRCFYDERGPIGRAARRCWSPPGMSGAPSGCTKRPPYFPATRSVAPCG